MFKHRRKQIFPVMIILALIFSGCVAGESEQKKAGMTIMKSHFADTGKKASVTSIYADVTRPAADRLDMTDYVKGTYSIDKESYDFWANVKTGSIYTDERMQEFYDSILHSQMGKLGFDVENCTCDVYINRPGFPLELAGRRPFRLR